MKSIFIFLKKIWKKYIADICPEEIEDIEFSEEYRNDE